MTDWLYPCEMCWKATFNLKRLSYCFLSCMSAINCYHQSMVLNHLPLLKAIYDFILSNMQCWFRKNYRTWWIAWSNLTSPVLNGIICCIFVYTFISIGAILLRGLPIIEPEPEPEPDTLPTFQAPVWLRVDVIKMPTESVSDEVS